MAHPNDVFVNLLNHRNSGSTITSQFPLGVLLRVTSNLNFANKLIVFYFLWTVCEKCSCSFEGNYCLRCEQVLEYEKSLKIDQMYELEKEQNQWPNVVKRALASTVAISPDPVVTDNPATTEELRKARLSYLRRDREKPIRYRHSIGSPSLSAGSNLLPAGDLSTTGNAGNSGGSNEDSNTAIPFGSDEIERFFEDDSHTVVNADELDLPRSEDDSNAIDFQKALAFYRSKVQDREKTVIIQRDTHYFWKVLFRQRFDLSQTSLNVRLSEEAAADAGGPFREFLTLAMKRIPELRDLTFGSPNKICCNANTDAVMSNKYHVLGQLTGVSILTNGRGPECLHPAIVRSMYNVKQPFEIEEVDDEIIKHSLAEIESGNYDCLLDLNISTIGKKKSDLCRLFKIASIVNKKFKAIDDFRAGMASISEALVSTKAYTKLRSFLKFQTKKISFDDISGLFRYAPLTECEVGSNDYNIVQQGIVEFEIFLAAIQSGEIMLNSEEPWTYGHILYFCTGVDRIPPFGFEKSIDVTFWGSSLPTASTCALELTLPFSKDGLDSHNIQNNMAIAINMGGGFW